MNLALGTFSDGCSGQIECGRKVASLGQGFTMFFNFLAKRLQ
ncbi:MAG: hypothetical protein PVH19_01925 [Planctomycetia bacterium]